MTPSERAAAAQERLREIFVQYRQTLGEQLDAIDDAALAALSGTLDAQGTDRGRRAAHKLAGSAGTFGFSEASTVARRVEQLLETERALGPAELLSLSQWAVELRSRLPLDDDAPVPDQELPAAADPAAQSEARLLLLVDADAARREQVAAAAVRSGLDVAELATADEARNRIQTVTPAVVVLALPEQDLGYESDSARSLIAQLAARPVPVIVLAPRDGFPERVEMARIGARSFLPRPVTPQQVLESVRGVLDRVRLDDMTVLAVDDDPAVLAALAEMLGMHGLAVRTLGEPMLFWQTLEDVSPDLLVLDVDMPGVSGPDLCRVVRAHARWSQLPVLFLTGSTDPQALRELFEAGADDYVAKPVRGPELVMRIANRLERLRLYRRLAETDPLTGVANRRKAADVLARLMTLASRRSDPVSVALLDLDRFKAVNDQYGHAAGDAVLRELGTQLAKAFRGEDVVARWGGEEFMVGMYGATREDAGRRLTQVLDEFRQRPFRSPSGAEFTASFSAGVAQHAADGADLPALYRAADAALYAAKSRGRGQVVAAGSAEVQVTHDVDVVLVEDDEALAPLLLHSLELRGLTTVWLREGDVAAQRLSGPVPEVRGRVLVLDWDLPGLNGASLLGRLAETGALRRTRVVMLTARSREDEILHVLELGAADHVAKPFSLPVLLERIRRQLDHDLPR